MNETRRHRWLCLCLLSSGLLACESPTGPTLSTPAEVPGGIEFVALSVGSAHTCGLTPDGSAYCWGSNDAGQLGDGSEMTLLRHSAIPVRVSGSKKYVTLAANGEGTCAITFQSELYCWGEIHCDTCASTPMLIDHAPAFVSIALGDNVICGLTSAGEALCKAYWYEGRLFGRAMSSAPELVTLSFGGDGSWTFLCGLARDRTAHCAQGIHDVGVAVPGDHRFEALSAGGAFACGIEATIVYCWGNNNMVGQMGRGTWTVDFNIPRDYSQPEPIAVNAEFSAITTGAAHSCALTTNGIAYCWGANQYYQLGHEMTMRCAVFTHIGVTSDRKCFPRPEPVSTSLRFVTVAAGGTHTCALTRERKAYCWGGIVPF